MKTLRAMIALSPLVLLSACEKKEIPPDPTMHVNAQQVYAHVIDYPVIPRVSGAIFKQL
jgi:hypothetical protein